MGWCKLDIGINLFDIYVKNILQNYLQIMILIKVNTTFK